jgi:hypothetical protein
MLKKKWEGVEVNDLTDVEAAYMAGFLDGEGSIMMIRRENGSVALVVSIANTHLPTLEYIRELLGYGNINQTREATARNKAGYLLRLQHWAAASLLRQTLPYMITKREQAEMAVEFAEKKKSPEYRDDKEDQALYHERMKRLNRRGTFNLQFT